MKLCMYSDRSIYKIQKKESSMQMLASVSQTVNASSFGRRYSLHRFALDGGVLCPRAPATTVAGQAGFHGGAIVVHAPAVRSSVDGLPVGKHAEMRAGMTGVSDGYARTTHQDER
jgi:hypothetical protein